MRQRGQQPTLLFVAGLAVLGCAHAPPGGAKVERVEVFAEPAGARVEVVFLTGDQALLHVTGSHSDLDDHVVLATREESGPNIRYLTPLDGRPQAPLWVRNRNRFFLSPPWQKDDLPVTRDEAASAHLDPQPLIERHTREAADGTLARLARFDRARHQRSQAEDLANALARAREACGYPLEVALDWAQVDDATLQRFSFGGSCGDVLSDLKDLCQTPSAREQLAKDLKTVTCALATPLTDADHLALVAGGLRADLGLGGRNTEAVQRLVSTLGRTPDLVTELPWGDGSALGHRLVLDQVRACVDPQGHLVAQTTAWRGTEAEDRLFTGDRQRLLRLPVVHPWYSGFFVDPRALRTTPLPPQLATQTAVPAKFFSSVEFDTDARACTVRCGERRVKLPMLAPAQVRTELLARALVPAPFTRQPHALLRDHAGTYYYVDTSSTPGREKDFHVFIGPRGKVAPRALVNALSDTEGELFITKGGELKLALDRKQPSFWLQGGRKVELRAVPVNENLDVIFLELGVYRGQALGTPCDWF